MPLITLPETRAIRIDRPRLVDYGGRLVPPGGGPVQTINRLGTRFALDVTLPTMRAEPDGRTWAAALAQAKVNGARMWFRQDGLNIGTPGTVTVNTGPQSGSLLAVKGFTGGYVARNGQFFSLVVGGKRYLHMVTADVPVWTAGAFPNVVFDGGLSLFGSGWVRDAGWGVIYGAFGEGPYWASGSNGTIVTQSQPFTAGTGVTVYLSLEMFTGGISAGSLRADVEWLNSGGAVISRSSPIIATNGLPFTRYDSGAIVSPAGTASGRVRIYLQSATNTNAAARLIKVSQTANAPFTDEATGAGAVLLPIFPMLRVSPGDGAICEFAKPYIEGSISGNEMAWTRMTAPYTDFGTITISEDA